MYQAKVPMWLDISRYQVPMWLDISRCIYYQVPMWLDISRCIYYQVPMWLDISRYVIIQVPGNIRTYKCPVKGYILCKQMNQTRWPCNVFVS